MKAISLEDTQVMAEQSKEIGELTNTVSALTGIQEKATSGTCGNPRTKPRFTDGGQLICIRCKGVGHIAKRCTKHWSVNDSTTTPASGVKET